MAFRIDKITDHYLWGVTVKFPNNGSFEKITVKVKFKRLPHDERVELLQSLENYTGSSEDYLSFENEVLDNIFLGWDKGQIVDENGNVEDTEANRRMLLDITEFRMAVIEGYFKSMGGEMGKPAALTA